MPEGPRARPSYPRLLIGAAVIALGIAFTLDNLGIAEIDGFWDVLHQFWPVLFVAIGIAQLVQAQTWTGWAGGMIWIVVGGWLLAKHFGIIDISIWVFWPAVLVVLGGWIITNGFRRQRPAADGTAATTDATLSAVAVMGGAKRRSRAKDFRGGDLIAFMGGITIDLRGAGIASGEARLDVFAMWGGIEIFVPEGWAVDAKVFPFMGGVDDHTVAPRDDAAPHLVVRGLAFMGGVDIKN